MSKECQNPNVKLSATTPTRRFETREFGLPWSFVIWISRARCFISSQARRKVSHSPSVTQASKRSAAHAELHLAHSDSAGSDHRRLRAQAQRGRGWRD